MELLADYFGFRRGAPNNGIKPSRNATYLYRRRGGYLRKGFSFHLQKTVLYWDAYAAADPVFREWWNGPTCMVAPEKWFDGIPFPDHLTPRVFADDFLPPSTRGRASEVYGSRAYQIWLLDIHEGLHELAAYAHGWPLSPPEKDLARRAAHELYLRPQFTAYALVDVTALPMPFSDRSFLERAARKHLLDFDPLSLTARTFRETTPDFARTPEDLLRLCPPRTEVAGSTKNARTLDAPQHGG